MRDEDHLSTHTMARSLATGDPSRTPLIPHP
jgi:hypothetical protein